MESEEDSLNSLIDEKKDAIEQVSDDIQNKEAAIAEYEAYIKEQNETIAMLEKVVAEEKAKLAEENRMKYDGGCFNGLLPLTRRSAVIMATGYILLSGWKGFIMEWIWRRRAVRRFWRLMTARLWRRITAVLWETI